MTVPAGFACNPMKVNYDHSKNLHTLGAPQAALPVLFEQEKPASLLDVGCGNGTWLEAALEFGIPKVFGLDGINIPPDKLHLLAGKFQQQDLTLPWNLNRRFDAVLCLEVAEHLAEAHAKTLIKSITLHGDFVIFSAACPGQPGQHHVNCQWPVYWQQIFNECGFACSDDVRWKIWGLETVEPWYRQNIFFARRNPGEAGREPRIPAAVHPATLKMIRAQMVASVYDTLIGQIEKGQMPVGWYFRTPFCALWAKLKRKLSP